MTAIGNSYSLFPQQYMNPDVYAQRYANENNLSLEDAKSKLKEEKGDPVKNDFDVSSVFDIIDGNDEKNGTSRIMSIFTQFLENFSNIFNYKGEPDDEMDPDAYAQKYADEHGITLEEAKEELRASEGEPTRKGGDSQAVSDNPFTRTGDPDADAQAYADANNMTLEEAKAELKAKYGDPVQPN